jgi:N-acetylneuraminic acid mutarotase
MIKIFLITVISLMLISSTMGAGETLNWKELPELPPVPGKANQPGLAGAFAGVHNDALIVAGGTNFPDGLPWNKLADGSSLKKIYNREIYVLQKDQPWKISNLKLPIGYSHGVSILTDDGLVCLGGEWCEYDLENVQKFKSDKVFLIKHLGEGKLAIDDTSLPVLPQAVSVMAGTKIGDYIYIVGGNNGNTETKSFWRLDLSTKNPSPKNKWEKLESWPGPPRSHHIVVAQSDGRKDCLYIFSGRFEHFWYTAQCNNVHGDSG